MTAEIRLKLATVLLLGSLPACDAWTKRTPNVCCSNDTECARLGLPPGSASDYGCSQGHVCRDFYCVAGSDDPTDAPVGRCKPDAPFGAPRRVFAMSSVAETDMALLNDELTAFVIRDSKVEMSTRTSIDADFPLPTATGLGLQALQGYGADGISPADDGRTVYMTRSLQPDFVVVSHRPASSSPFSNPSLVSIEASRARMSSDSMTLYWIDSRQLLYKSLRLDGRRDSFHEAFLSNNDFEVTDFAISADELVLYWSLAPAADIFVSARTSKHMRFGFGVPVENVNSSAEDVPLFVTRDGCELYFRSNRTSVDSIWVARRPSP